MKFALSVFVFGLLFSGSALAFESVSPEFSVQYEIVTIENPEVKQLILGELADSPEMYEITTDSPFLLTLEIRALPNDNQVIPDLNGIIIKQKEIRGVEEVARLEAKTADWSLQLDKKTGLHYLQGPSISKQLEPGTYRFEISTPNNKDKYILSLGNVDDDNGFFASLAAVKNVYNFYGLSGIHMFSSPYVHYPVGILLLLILIGATYLWQKKNRNYA